MPYPSTLRRSSSVPASLARFDPIFSPYKDQLANAKTFLTFDPKTETLVQFYYPCYDDGTRVPLDELLDYWETHDMPTPVCFCFLKTGEAKETVLFIARWPPGEHYGTLCLACEDGLCGCFASVTRTFNSNDELPCKTYPLLEVARRRRIPARLDQTPPTTPKRQRAVGGSAAGLILGGATTAAASARSPSVVGPTPSPRPLAASPATGRSSKAVSPIKSEALNGHQPPYTQAALKPFPMKFEATSRTVEEGISGLATGAHGSEPAFALSLLKLDGAGATKSEQPLPEDEALETLLQTADTDSPGITVVELARALGMCNRCRRIVVSARLPTHACLPDGWSVETYKDAMANAKDFQAPSSQPDADGSPDEASDTDVIPMPAKKKARITGPVPKRADWAFRRSVDKLASSSRGAGSGAASSSRGAGGSGAASSSRGAGGSGRTVTSLDPRRAGI
ncbi:hypothetical protein FA95DRAFT_1602412 [Auriscalpium vulgare]|uniref:Uncharacterized protein n=1 Tax=Auriscalpium vulgare TaxID=40419 RepID=A0ACB8S687_9AGAM|nr:hypothetical protein FA95DRAFT_1602412 [Auriscalpium vulgare]